MNKFITVASFVILASPAFAQGMAAPSGGMASGEASPSHMAGDTMKMDHKKPMKKSAMKHDGMSMAAPTGGMASGGMASGDKMAAPQGGMSNANH
jgi:pentapeptide MXKDX repeat protein